jgi:hypothetical protein
MIWSYESSGVYSSKFLYEIVNFKGIQHIYLPENDVYESFGVMITDFLSLESKWLCNTRYMQLNIVSSAVLWSILNNRNSIVFNRKPWMNIK